MSKFNSLLRLSTFREQILLRFFTVIHCFLYFNGSGSEKTHSKLFALGLVTGIERNDLNFILNFVLRPVFTFLKSVSSLNEL